MAASESPTCFFFGKSDEFLEGKNDIMLYLAKVTHSFFGQKRHTAFVGKSDIHFFFGKSDTEQFVAKMLIAIFTGLCFQLVEDKNFIYLEILRKGAIPHTQQTITVPYFFVGGL